MSVIIAQSRKELLGCYPVVAQLRPHLSEAEFLARVERQTREGYTLAFIEDTGPVVCVAGFRIMNSLAWGRLLYVDDLVTAEQERSKGHGRQMFAWLVAHSKANDCAELHLDSGVQRFGAHRFYLSAGMDITCHHFALKLKS